MSSPTTNPPDRVQYPVLEMACAACALSVEGILCSVPGVEKAGVNYATHTAWVTFKGTPVSPEQLREAVRAGGYDLIISAEDPLAEQEAARIAHFREVKQRAIGASVLALPVFVLGMFGMHWPYSAEISLLLSAPVVFWFGRSFFANAWKQARRGSSNMDTLVALSTGIAWVFSAFSTLFPAFWIARGLEAHVYFEAAAVVVAFILLGKLLEERAKAGTSAALKKLMSMQSAQVTVLTEDGAEERIPAIGVQPGFRVLIRPGERLPVDGTLAEGTGYIDESMITGEPVPVEKRPGEKVYAGTVAQNGSFVLIANEVGSQTVLAQIIRRVQEAQGSQAPVQRIADRIAGIFVPAVLLISLLTFGVWMWLGGAHLLTHALLSTVSVLVIACPCALGLATPTALMVGVGKGAENHILIRDAESLEMAHRVTAVVLDKTGTLTEGRPSVQHIRWAGSAPEAEAAARWKAMASRSEHPLSQAIAAFLPPSENSTLHDFEALSGLGIRAAAGNTALMAGNLRLMEEQRVKIPEALHQQALQWQEQAMTLVWYAEDGQAVALAAIADPLKPSSALAVRQLQQRGLKVWMLTGDHPGTAAAVAEQTGISQWKAGMLPEDKADFVRQLRQQGEVVAMVGDGLNDSPALAEADVSMAMGKGTDLAMDVAKITLVTSDLTYIAKALLLSKKTVSGIYQNLFWAFIYNLIGIPIAAGLLYPLNGFLLNPMLAGAAMALSSVSVVLNSLRLRSIRL